MFRISLSLSFSPSFASIFLRFSIFAIFFPSFFRSLPSAWSHFYQSKKQKEKKGSNSIKYFPLVVCPSELWIFGTGPCLIFFLFGFILLFDCFLLPNWFSSFFLSFRTLTTSLPLIRFFVWIFDIDIKKSLRQFFAFFRIFLCVLVELLFPPIQSTFRGVCFSKAAVAGKKFEGRQCFNKEELEVRNKKVKMYKNKTGENSLHQRFLRLLLFLLHSLEIQVHGRFWRRYDSCVFFFFTIVRLNCTVDQQ